MHAKRQKASDFVLIAAAVLGLMAFGLYYGAMCSLVVVLIFTVGWFGGTI